MVAHNDNFPWLSYYGHYSFFEERMRDHNRVNSFVNQNVGLYEIELTGGRRLNVFICECYSFGMAEYIEVCENYGALDAVVISSNWCSYSIEVKHHCMEHQVGIFDIRGFMAAINRREYWTYLTEYEAERFRRYGWM